MTVQLNRSFENCIRKDVRQMHAYIVQNAISGMVKLDAMENPYSLPEDLRKILGARLGELAFNRYPGSRIEELRGSLEKHVDLPQGYGLILGNGSDELISLLALACDMPGAGVLAPVPGFVMYELSSKLQGLKFYGISLTADFELDEKSMLDAIQSYKPTLTYLAYPNNPTANLWDDDVIVRLIEAVGYEGGLVVIDEAYQPFSSKSFLSRLISYPHVLLLRTLSKFGLAGARIGYLIGQKILTDEIEKVRPPYNVSILNCECALFALEHQEVFEQQAMWICEQRTVIMSELQVIDGLKAYPSEANMILIRVPDAKKSFELMRNGNILVKNVSNMHPLLKNCLRLTVGTPDENRLMLQVLRESI